MSLVRDSLHALQGAPVPDPLARLGIGWLVERTRRRLADQPPDAEAAFALAMAARPIAENTREANEQHYELPADFFGLVLGQHRKYSCCFYEPGDALETAEARALAATCERAGLSNGQSILELGCGWGSLSLWMAERYPGSTILAVSNSHSQRVHIEAEASRRGLANLQVVTADMNAFGVDRRFDRVVSVEMFEHMANWPALLERVRGWLKPDGRLFVHVFTHRAAPYRFDLGDRSDWIAQHFFAGGVMPSHGLIGRFGDLFRVEDEWRWDGRHYERTALDWLANYDRNAGAVMAILRRVYGGDARLWFRRWRLFFLATAGLFGCRGGEEWGVSHYRLCPVGADQ
jgi:cyclopropane-fatty-acyl-phospholipid synthase